MTAKFDRLKAARLAEDLAEELAKLNAEPDSIQKMGGILTAAKFVLPALGSNLHHDLYRHLDPSRTRPVCCNLIRTTKPCEDCPRREY
jgi:hypothetical protein